MSNGWNVVPVQQQHATVQVADVLIQLDVRGGIITDFARNQHNCTNIFVLTYLFENTTIFLVDYHICILIGYVILIWFSNNQIFIHLLCMSMCYSWMPKTTILQQQLL